MTEAEWLRYANSGATRNLPLDASLIEALSFLPELGLTMEVFSGGQPPNGSNRPRVGSTRHDNGLAADAFFYKDGRRLDWNNPDDLPLFTEVVQRAKANNVSGFGAGKGYMMPGSMHIGFGDSGVWGAGGKGENAADWLRAAFDGVPGGVASTFAPGGQPKAPLSFGLPEVQDPSAMGLADMFGAGGLSMGMPVPGQKRPGTEQQLLAQAQQDTDTKRKIALAELMRF
jgi:hypothetical protein